MARIACHAAFLILLFPNVQAVFTIAAIRGDGVYSDELNGLGSMSTMYLKKLPKRLLANTYVAWIFGVLS